MKRILDPCCGSRMMWFDRQHPEVVFGDNRNETIIVPDHSHDKEKGQRGVMRLRMSEMKRPSFSFPPELLLLAVPLTILAICIIFSIYLGPPQ